MLCRRYFSNVNNVINIYLFFASPSGDSLDPPRITTINIISSVPLPHSEEARVQQQQNSARALHRRRQRENQQQRAEQQQQHWQQPQQLLPDLVTSCEQSASPPPPPPPAPPASPPQQQQQLQAQQQSAADAEDDKIAGAVKLQVAVCPACYYSKERKLKVIAIAKLDENGKPIRWTCNNRDVSIVHIIIPAAKLAESIFFRRYIIIIDSTMNFF